MEYIGEHLLIGKVGNVFIILSFVFALLASISYFFAARQNEETLSWKKIGRWSFRIHALSVIGIVVTLFIMLFNHYFEYEYVWHHSNKAMPMRYILSCFWEGQEGSFLLWTFWHVVLGLILQRTTKEWEAPVMSVISLVQAFLASMLLGIFIFGDNRIGSNPFTVLLREHPDWANIPLFTNPNYLEKIDGNGLNPLLQNYWMTIHPPTLFLGFALTVVPFAYAIAGLWTRKFTEWLKPALPWTFMAIAVLGIGILMGGAWAYEALSFGGFWAWDPVENASLVPWLTLVGAGHLMLINKNKGQSLFTAFALAILTFVLILYSTFLTRSGILGETSVHAFTDLGMSGQLLIYLLFFLLLGILLLIMNWKHMPKVQEEESLYSREFWMFVGAIILLISSFQIMFYTSMPVWNKLFDLKMAPAKDVIGFYNAWQLPFAFLVTILIAIGQFFKYKNTDPKEFFKKITFSLLVSVLLTGLFSYILSYNNALYILLMFSSIFAAVSNFNYITHALGGKIRKAGASVAHIGFGLIMLGVLISTSKKDIISQNSSGKDISALGEKMTNNDNILLTQGDTLPMGNYWVTFRGRRAEGINVYFDVDYFTKENNTYVKEFTLSPLFQVNPRMGNVPEPDTRHFLTFDVYTHVTYALIDAPNKTENTKDEYTAAKNVPMKRGDTVFSSNAIIIFDSLSTNFDRSKYNLKDDDIAVMANISVLDIRKKYQANPVYVIRDNAIQPVPSRVDDLGLQFMFWKVDPQNGNIEISVQEKKANVRDFLVMQAMIFPYINILWMGCIVMFIGTLMAILERIRKS
ncbi:MAG: cytochrome c biosis factor [Bacteroidetes bacterium]|jgi:cytochrome c-type biogenesis protein CcmF|nr:cytochrome c biosis factor [Bacteroidota bacterium]